jgi:murein DD-endopeptidase MepM/ murein hydrolase activator NlpD
VPSNAARTLRGLVKTGGTTWTRRAVGVGALIVVAVFGAAAFAAVRGDEGQDPSGAVPAAVAVPPAGHLRDDLARRAARRRASDKLAWPLHGKVTGTFGESRGGHPHEGIDIPMPPGTPIKAAANGGVIMRELQSGYGKYTCVAHRTITTCYAHQSRFATTVGAKVRRGEVIGYVGNTGDTTAYHLHFEVRRGTRPWGTPVDPAKFLPGRARSHG